MITQQRLQELLRYDPQTGELFWRQKTCRKMVPGRRAGSYKAPQGVVISIDGKRFLAHRLVWLMLYGAWPAQEIDHINGNPHDNRLANLREASHAENLRNTKLRADNSSGFKGVRRMKSRGKLRGRWIARIRKDGKETHLGCFASAAEAHTAYCIAANELFGEFARHS